MSDILQRSVAFTGDVDTVAALALGAAAASWEVNQDIPDRLVEGLENGAYGHDFLLDLDQKIISLTRSLNVREATK